MMVYETADQAEKEYWSSYGYEGGYSQYVKENNEFEQANKEAQE